MQAPPLPTSVSERTVPEVLDLQAAAIGDRVALIAPSLVSGDEATFSYATLRASAGRLASALAERGVARGDRVAILLDNDGAAEAHLTYHASHRLGAINVPLNTRYVQRELAYVIDFIGAAAIVFGPSFAPLLANMRGSLGNAVLLEIAGEPVLGESFAAAMAASPPDVERVALYEGDDADWIFTSGTTGNPKAVALTHGGSVACGHQAGPLWGLDETSIYQSFAPFFTSTGCHTNLLGCLVAGCTYVVEPEFGVPDSLERLKRHGATSSFLINPALQLIFHRLGPEGLADYGLHTMRRICWGGQSAGPDLCRTIHETGRKMNIELVNVYGLTEGGTSGMMLRPDEHEEAFERMGAYGLSIGRAGFHPWIEHAVLNSDGRPVTPGEMGELCLRSPSLMSRYVNDQEATDRALRDGWLHTGDVCTVDDAGFVYFVDRDQQLIRRGGLNISSAEVEGVLVGHPGVAEAAAVGMENPILGEDVRAVVVPATDSPPSAEELIAFCRERLADYKVPVRVDFVESLPRNGMGRVVKGVLTGKVDSLRGSAD